MDSEDDFDWEEVPVPEHEQHIEITLQPTQKAASPAKKRPAGISYAERLLRIDCHKLHTVALLVNARTRNKWVNDPLLHARLLSMTPMHLQNAFAMIHKTRIPNQNQRGRMFEAAVRNLTDWWTNSFFDVLPEGHIRNRTYDDVQLRLTAEGIVPKALSGDPPVADSSSQAVALVSFLTSTPPIFDVDVLKDLLDDEGETIRSPNSLMKHALMHSGSRDTGAQLFTALCRALGIPARLVVSLQSVPWQTSIGRPKPKKKIRKGEETQDDGGDDSAADGDDMEEIDIPVLPSVPIPSLPKGKAKAIEESEPLSDPKHRQDGRAQSKSAKAKGKERARPPVKLRKQKSKGRSIIGGTNNLRTTSPRDSPNPLSTPPVFWTEVFSRPDGRWLPIDPIRGIVNKRKVFDPMPLASSAAGPSAQGGSRVRQENRMLYVLAFEEDAYARDVTRRYAREYSTKVAKAQAGGRGKGRQLWWQRVVSITTRPYRLQRDDVEDEELEIAQLMEGMPTTLAGFKDHPLYVLERHLKQNEVIHPPPPDTSELGKFRGEPVYPQSAVVNLKTAETWMRTEGRTVKPGCQPLKMVKLRASTVGKMREIEVLREADATQGGPTGSEITQSLYAQSQTEPFVPDPVVDGVVPKNNFGNIDLYVPSMLPKGAVHVPFRGIAKIARKLGFDHAEAVTGFEFKKRRAFPVIEGIVIVQENESVLLEAYWEAERIAGEKARAKHEDQVIKRWVRLIQGLRIRRRLQNQYANKPDDSQQQQRVLELNSNDKQTDNSEEKDKSNSTAPGGFLVEADDVVQAFSLPEYQHVNLPFNPIPNKSQQQQNLSDEDDKDLPVPEYITYDIQAMDVDPAEIVNGSSLSTTSVIAPMTMQELAEAAARKQAAKQSATSIEIGENARTVTNMRTLRSRKSPSQGTPNPTKGGVPVAKRQSVPKTRSTGRSRASRKRRRSGDEEEDDSGIDSDEPPIDSDGAGSDHEGGDDQLSPKKRTRTLVGSSSHPTPSTRVLRPRRKKTRAQIEEQDGEDG